MKKSIPFFLCSLVLTSLTTFGCSNENTIDSSSSSSYSSILPGKDRIWWYQGFDNINDAASFMVNLKNAQKNEDFNFGVSEFDLLGIYKKFSIIFSGHIRNGTSNKEDIFNSVYDIFEIDCIYHEDTTVLPINNQIYVNFYPFNCDKDNFNNDEIKYTVTEYYDGKKQIDFEYNETMIIRVKLSSESNSIIDKEKLINELIQNYRVIV